MKSIRQLLLRLFPLTQEEKELIKIRDEVVEPESLVITKRGAVRRQLRD